MMPNALCHWFLLLVLVLLGASRSTGEPEKATPEAVIREYYSAFERSDLSALAGLVKGAKVTPALEALEKDFKASRELIVNVKAIKLTEGDETITATVSLFGSFKPKPEEGEKAEDLPKVDYDETLRLEKTAEGWRIVPATQEEIKKLEAEGVGLPVYAFVMYPEQQLAERLAARRARCVSNIRFLAIGAKIYGLDWDKWDLTAATLQKKLLVHVRGDKEYFHCPHDRKLLYTFNSKLYGVNPEKVVHPERTVLFYEGKGGVLNYTHSGTAVVAFADAKARAVTPTEAKKLKWSP